MAKEGLRPIISHALDLFQMRISYLFQNTRVRIFIYVPGYLFSELPFKLYEFSPLSILQHTGNYFMIKSTDKFLAIQEGLESDAKMIVMTIEEFHHKCQGMGPKRWACIRPRIIKDPRHHCLSSIFYEHGLDTCPASNLFKALPKKTLTSGLVTIASTTGQIVTFFPTPTEVSVRCGNKHLQTLTTIGYQLWPSFFSKCQIHAPHWSIPMSPRPVVEAVVVSRELPIQNSSQTLFKSTEDEEGREEYQRGRSDINGWKEMNMPNMTSDNSDRLSIKAAFICSITSLAISTILGLGGIVAAKDLVSATLRLICRRGRRRGQQEVGYGVPTHRGHGHTHEMRIFASPGLATQSNRAASGLAAETESI